jgi:serine/threonine-protein kinase
MEIAKIGRYEIIETLGQGAMGIVYKGMDTALSRIVAIKTVKLQETASTPQENKLMVDRFCHEARIAGQLSHPNIATIYDVGENDGIHFIVMEYIEGMSLEEIIKGEKSLSLKEKIKIIILTARSLHYAHHRGVVHRDIKPANIMLIDDLQVKIMDFGIAQLSSKDDLFKTQPGHILGTPSYMSPEHLSGEPLSRQSDIFSLGVFSYELLSGEKPFKSENLAALIKNIVNDRYQTANEYADDLELFLKQQEMKSTQVIPAAKGYSKENLIESLKNNYPFFSDFTDAELKHIFKISSKKVYKKGDVIFKDGTIGNEMYIIISGEITITKKFKKDDDTVLNDLKAGDIFGEMAIVDESPRYATATANSDSILIAINEVILRNSEPRLCLKLYKSLSSILSEKLKKSDETINRLKMKIKKYRGDDVV